MLTDLLPLTINELVLCIVIIFVAYVIKGLSGFGSGLVAIPLLAFFLPLPFIVPVLALVSYTGTVYQSFTYRSDVVWRDLWPLLPFSLSGITIALWLLVNTDVTVLTLTLGIFIFCYAVYSLLPHEIKSGSRWWAVAAGSSAGLIGALFGTGGPFYVLYLKMRQVTKQQFRATITMIFLVDGGARMSGYFYTDLFTQKTVMLSLVLLPVLFVAMYVGQHLHIKINDHRFNQVVSVLLLVSGLSLAIKSVYLLV